MKNLLNPASIAFYFLMLIAFFFLGIYFAGFIEAGKNQGLAGGAIVLGYGVLFGGIAFIASFFIAYNLTTRKIVRLNWILLLLILIAYGITHYRYLERQKEDENEKVEMPRRKTTETPPVAEPTAMLFKKELELIKNNALATSEDEMGIGFFHPNYFEHPTLYFYGNINPEKGLTDHTPMDSVVFTNDKYNNPTTTYAPPWLYPEHLKLDYGIIIFKAIGIGNDFIKVEANSQTKQPTYLDKQKGTFTSWPEFLLSMNSVEFISESGNKVHIKPLDYAGEVNASFTLMKPLIVQDDWMYVKLLSDSLKEQGKGWVRWKKDGKLLLRYSLLC